MSEQSILDLLSRSIWLAMQIAAPVLLAALVTGIIVSVFQAATQINEQTMSFIPKIFVMFIALMVFGPWILQTMVNFTVLLIKDIAALRH